MLFAPGFAEGFSRGCGRDTRGERGEAGRCPRATVGERESEKGDGALRAARGECGARAGRRERLRTPAGGMGRAQLGSQCLHLRASHLCREADRPDPPSPAGRPGRRSGSGGSASWEGPVGREAAAGAWAGRPARGGTWAARAARGGGQCPPQPSRAGAGPPPLTSPSLAAGARGRLSSAILLSSRSSPAPCGHFPYSPGRGRLVSVWNLFLNKTGTGSVVRAPSDRLLDPLSAKLALGDRAAGRFGGAAGEEARGGFCGGCPSSFSSGGPRAPLLLQLGNFIACQQRTEKIF